MNFWEQKDRAKIYSDYKKGRLVYLSEVRQTKMKGTKFVGTSLTIVSAIALLFVTLTQIAGFEFAESEVTPFVEGVIAVVVFVGIVVGRFRATKSVTLTP